MKHAGYSCDLDLLPSNKFKRILPLKLFYGISGALCLVSELNDFLWSFEVIWYFFVHLIIKKSTYRQALLPVM